MAYAERWGDDKISIHTEYREREIVKMVPGAKWNSEHRTWYCPLSWAACVQLRGVFGSALEVGPSLAEYGQFEKVRVDECLMLRAAEDADVVEQVPTLYDYQRAGVRFMAKAGAALNADEMGTGKTAQTIATLEVLDAYPALIVCPNSVKDTWANDEYPKWAPHRKVITIGGSAANRRKALAALKNGEADVGVIHWDILRLHSRLGGYGNIRLEEKDKEEKELNEIPFKAIVADEAHRAKEPRSKQTRALWWLGKHALHRFALTGTPIANAPDDLWAIMHFVDPREWPTKSQFIDRYALQSWNNFGFMDAVGIRPEMKDELYKILDPRFIRRTKAQVLPNLPPKVYVKRYTEMPAKQKKAYEAIRKEMIAELDGGILTATNPLTKLTRLMQFASAFGELDEGGNLKLTEPSCKVDALMDVVDELGDQQAIFFAESRQLVEIATARLLKAKYNVGQITGAVSPDERAANKNAFQDGKLQFLGITLGAGGEGLTLTNASAVVFLQRSFSLIKNKQAEDRAHRPGQENESVQIIDLVTPMTVDEMPLAALMDKSERAEEIVRDQAALALWLKKKP